MTIPTFPAESFPLITESVLVFPGPVSTGPPPAHGASMLAEDGSYILAEDGSTILEES